ncbi:unnamed protein product [Dovyalis caffra]|uniref:Uncharacterized protein n=1 Tax=Dovyalis caffra TaxID=77055 RepID=A0AAV1S724_9ROSI|nr:unnamed protein product [Dovyalis caffra]
MALGYGVISSGLDGSPPSITRMEAFMMEEILSRTGGGAGKHTRWRQKVVEEHGGSAIAAGDGVDDKER